MSSDAVQIAGGRGWGSFGECVGGGEEPERQMLCSSSTVSERPRIVSFQT